MTFAALPGYRMAYDRDGSAVYKYLADGTPAHPAEADWKLINNEENTGIPYEINGGVIAVVFPLQVDLVAYYFGSTKGTTTNNAAYAPRQIDVSPDTANGLDGTWTNILDLAATIDNLYHFRNVIETYRTAITVEARSGIKGIRVRNTATSPSNVDWHRLSALHIYTAQPLSFLRLWHPSLDQPLPYDWLDWGTFYVGEADTKLFRVKNIRAQTAQNVTLDVTTYTGAANSGYHTFSLDGATWARPLDIGDLAPGEISPVVQVSYAPPLDAVIQPYASQVSAIPLSWV